MRGLEVWRGRETRKDAESAEGGRGGGLPQRCCERRGGVGGSGSGSKATVAQGMCLFVVEPIGGRGLRSETRSDHGTGLGFGGCGALVTGQLRRAFADPWHPWSGEAHTLFPYV